MRPKIICHMVSSIDGRLIADRWTDPAAGLHRKTLLAHYEDVASRFAADAWLVGRKTMERHYAEVSKVSGEAGSTPREPHLADRGERGLAVCVDPHGKLRYRRDDADGSHLVAILGEAVPDAYLAELRADGVSYLFAGPEGDDLAGAMATLRETFGVHLLLLEGGGIINGAFLKAGLIDEISLLIYPGIDGLAGVSSIFEYLGDDGDHPAAGLALRHLATETLSGGMIWLRYAVETSTD